MGCGGKGVWPEQERREEADLFTAKLPASDACVWHESNLRGRAAVRTAQPPAGGVAGELEQQESSGRGGEEHSNLGNSW